MVLGRGLRPGDTAASAPSSRVRSVRILAIDGGGIRGLIPALVLAEIERRTSRRIADLVDLVAGPGGRPTVQRKTCCLAFTLPRPKICAGCCIT